MLSGNVLASSVNIAVRSVNVRRVQKAVQLAVSCFRGCDVFRTDGDSHSSPLETIDQEETTNATKAQHLTSLIRRSKI